ncbi:hypothetical protein KQ51_01040 [Candidatus Izimaplasma bacterium HR1]|jgi:hypothetical protein|uniref:hypothetical protein n=1 Tax=Candidatus Izimoplasma sp. HR1 TaxID=1541959 RepID=UPI0004F843E4|nr:hypothetical protein KQ51_01040 [Candidatus Izimaplasma bacterium HR1]
MVEILRRIMKSKFDYQLEDYAIHEIHRGRSRVVLYSTILFVVALIFYLLDVFEVFANFMSLGIIIVLLAVLIVAPYSLTKSKFEAIIVTPKHLIQRISKREFIVLKFDEITDFKIGEEGILIKENKHKIVLSTDLFQEEVEPIIEILEAKGKTFDKEKDFMIRPIKVIINDNSVSIEDDEDITETEKIYEKYHHEFPILTPGFIEEINFRNSLIDDALIEGDNVFLYLSTLEVKGGHPENTTFDALHATDCLFVIENMKIKKLYREDLNSKDKEIEELPLDVEGALDYIEKAVINEWKLDGKTIEMSFASGVYMLHARITYDEVIIGWKQAK